MSFDREGRKRERERREGWRKREERDGGSKLIQERNVTLRVIFLPETHVRQLLEVMIHFV